MQHRLSLHRSFRFAAKRLTLLDCWDIVPSLLLHTVIAGGFMLPPFLLVAALLLLAPWFPDQWAAMPSAGEVPAVLLVPDQAASADVERFDATAASREVLQGVAAQLKAKGVVVLPQGDGSFLVVPRIPAVRTALPSQAGDREASVDPVPVMLSVGFSVGTTAWASGTETHFAGGEEAAWRLAARVQRRLVGGLRDVLGYDSYDRGVVEYGPGDLPPMDIPTQQPAGEWVVAYPLFATNPKERALLGWHETLDLIAAALADAIQDYLDPSVRTPPRSSALGWRTPARLEPVLPRLITGVERGTRVALTFDGGASSAPTPAILKALRDAGVKATMFMTSEFVESNPELVVQMARDGHEFGNHSSTHPDMTKLSSTAIISELSRLEAAVYALTGKSTRPWFRPPFGAYNGQLVEIAAEQGYYTVLWTADSADWRDDVSPATVEGRLLRYASPGAILVEHLGSPQSAQVLPEVLRLLKEQGIRFGTLSEVVGTP